MGGLVFVGAAAARDIVTQKIDPATPTLEGMFCASIVVGIGSWLLGYGEPWKPLALHESFLILIQGGARLAGALLLVQACRFAPLSLVAAFRYTMLIWGGLAGYFIFDDIPDYLSLLGGMLIAGSGLYTFYREAVRRRALASKAIALN